MRPRRLIGARGAGVALGGALLALIGVALVRVVPVPSQQAAAALPRPVPAAGPAAFAPSLVGTTTEDIASASAGASLVLDPGLIRLFDHYLTTLGERSLEEIRAQLARELAHRYAPPAAREAVDVLDRYIAFREALRTAA